MDCIIKVISGPDAGQEFRCSALETAIGRSARCAVRLTSPSVSFEHAVIVRNGDEFFLENLSANGTFLNDQRVTGKSRLRTKDRIRIGDDTVTRVESVPSAAGGGSARRYLLVTVVLLMVAMLAVVILDPFSGSSSAENWPLAYQKLEEWTQREVAANKLPSESASLLQEAWRQEKAGDRPAASKAWVRLRVLLADAEGPNGSASTGNRRALSAIMSPDKAAAPSDDEMNGALIQFVTEMERRK